MSEGLRRLRSFCSQLVKALLCSLHWDEAAPWLACSGLSPVLFFFFFPHSEKILGEQEAVSCVSCFTRRALFEEVSECKSQIEYNGDTK